MILAGLQKNSFIDYPGRISCVLFVSGCNFVCPYCHNAELARGEYPDQIPAEQIFHFLASRRGMLDGVTITGGEPTLHGGLTELCRMIKTLGFPVKIDTNGSQPDVLAQLIDQRLVDFVAMDVKAPLDHYQPFCRQPAIAGQLRESIRLIMTAAAAYEFRTTCTAPLIDRMAIVAIAHAIEGADHFVLQSFNRRASCLDPRFDADTDPTLSDAAMQQLRVAATPLVKRCTIR